MPSSSQTGRARIDLARYELSVDGRRVKIERQPMELLIFLAQKKSQLVSREDIIDKLWGKDVFVDVDQSVNAVVRKIRIALRDDPAAPKYLETVVGKGYRFIGDVEVNSPNPAAVDAAEKLPQVTDSRNWKRLAIIPVGVFAVAILAGWVVYRWRAASAAPERAIRSIAVLPLANLSGDPSQDYFADGMSDELITDLAKIAALSVVSRTSASRYKGSQKPMVQIAEELKVDAVVEGSVLRSGNRVRITAQLIDAHSDRHLWSESYERDLRDVLALQNEVADAIAQKIQARVIPQTGERSRPRPVNPAAYDAYLRGRYCWNERTDASLRNAADYFRRAITTDPSYAPAYSGLVDVLITRSHYQFDAPNQVLPEARHAALQAVQLDDASAETHTSLAILYVDMWDWNQAEREFQRAISLNPRYATAHHWFSDYLSAVGQHEQAIEEEKKALELEPLSPIINTWMGRRYYFARKYEKAFAAVQGALELDPNFEPGLAHLGLIAVQLKQYPEAIAAFSKAAQTSAQGRLYLALLSYGDASAGQNQSSRKIVEQLVKESRQQYVPSYVIAETYVALGDRQRALQWLNRAIDEHSDWMMYMGVDPALDPIRSDPHFSELMRRVGIR